MFRLIKVFILSIIIITLTACNQDSSTSSSLKVGTISGPETQIMEVAKQVAKDKYGLDIKIIEFTDYLEPNTALNDGSIDANVFQHQPFLDQQIKDRHFKLIAVGKTFIYPMGIYSHKLTSLQQVSQGALVAIPNDPSNEGRALLLLEKAGLIHLKPNAGMYATVFDIQDNPKKLRIKELDAAQLARSLIDVDLAVINTNYAIPAGLSPTKDAILHEDKDSPYANIIVVRENETTDPRIKQLVESLQSQAVLDAAKKLFNDQAIPAWVSKS